MTQNTGNGEGKDLQRIVERSQAADAPEAGHDNEKPTAVGNGDYVPFGKLPIHQLENFPHHARPYLGRRSYHR